MSISSRLANFAKNIINGAVDAASVSDGVETTGNADTATVANSVANAVLTNNSFATDAKVPNAISCFSATTLTNVQNRPDTRTGLAVLYSSGTTVNKGDQITTSTAATNLLREMVSWSSIAYNPSADRYVAVASNTNIGTYFSSNGDCSTGFLTSFASWSSIAYGNGKFVAVSEDGRVAYSFNGALWRTTGINGFTDIQPTNVVYGNGVFVALDSSGNRSNNQVAYSTDGLTWTALSVPAMAGFKWRALAYGNGKFVSFSYENPLSVYSSDGIVWTRSLINEEFITLTSVIYGNDRFVGISLFNASVYSTDGIAWSRGGIIPNPGSRKTSIAYGDGKFVVSADGDNSVYYSTDGLVWTSSSQLFPSLPFSNWNTIIYANNRFTMLAAQSSYLARSTDGITWDTTTTGATPLYFTYMGSTDTNGPLVPGGQTWKSLSGPSATGNIGGIWQRVS